MRFGGRGEKGPDGQTVLWWRDTSRREDSFQSKGVSEAGAIIFLMQCIICRILDVSNAVHTKKQQQMCENIYSTNISSCRPSNLHILFFSAVMSTHSLAINVKTGYFQLFHTKQFCFLKSCLFIIKEVWNTSKMRKVRGKKPRSCQCFAP